MNKTKILNQKEWWLGTVDNFPLVRTLSQFFLSRANTFPITTT
jgi:hypothetical protein